MPKLPHFPFYPDSWLSSQKVMTEMDDAERGIYITLLAAAWNYDDCMLPLDVEKCRVMCRSRRKTKVEKVLQLCFIKTDNGWQNEREIKEKLKAIKNYEQKVEAGKKSGEARGAQDP